MCLGNVPILAFIGGVTACRQCQSPTVLQLPAKPLLALHDPFSVIKPFDMPCGTNHRVIPVGKLRLPAKGSDMTFRAERYQVADGVRAARFYRRDVMNFKTCFGFSAFHAPATVTIDGCQAKVVVQAV